MEPTAADLMSMPVRKVTISASVRDAARFLLRHRITGALVVDESGRPAGVFTLRDVAARLQAGLEAAPTVDNARERTRETGERIPLNRGFHFESFDDAPVSDFMTPEVITVPGEALIGEVARVMVRRRIHRVFVELKGRIEGVLTTMDLLAWVARTGEPSEHGA